MANPTGKWKAEMRSAIAELVSARMTSREAAHRRATKTGDRVETSGAIVHSLERARDAWKKIDALMADVPVMGIVEIVDAIEDPPSCTCPDHAGVIAHEPDCPRMRRVDELAAGCDCIPALGAPAAGCPVHDPEPGVCPCGYPARRKLHTGGRWCP